MWTLKYRPKHISEVVGQENAKQKFLNWINSWRTGDKAALFYGPNGVGKTSMVYAYAEENNLDVIELNASDYRTSKQINEVIGASSKQKSLFKKGKIFLIDEIDGLSTEDKSGISEIVKLIKESKHPIVFTSNNPWDKKISKIKDNCVEIQFTPLSFWDVLKVLKKICEKEKVKHDEEILKYIAKLSSGDLRAAINDLQTIASGKNEISIRDAIHISIRERESTIFECLKIIFKTNSAIASKSCVENVDKDLEEIFWWIEENIPNEYENKEEIAKAYDMLSLADIYLSKARMKNYKMMKYFIDFMTVGVSLSKKQQYKKFVNYRYPQIIKYLALTKANRMEENEYILDLAKKLHCSTKKVRTHYLPFLKFLPRNNK